MESEERGKILQGLERVLSGEEVIKYIEPFNPEKAIKVRKTAGINRINLAKELGISGSYLHDMEVGKQIPHYPLRRKQKAIEKYIKWLASNGYNPYNIDFSKPQE